MAKRPQPKKGAKKKGGPPPRTKLQPRRGQGPRVPPMQQVMKGPCCPLMDPRNKTNVPVPRTIGSALPITGMAEMSFTTIEHGYTLAVLQNTGNSGTVAMVMQKAGATTLGVPKMGTIPLLATTSWTTTAGGATSGRAMKLGGVLVNTTRALNMGGRFYALNCPNRLGVTLGVTAWTTQVFNSFCDRIVEYPDRLSYHPLVHLERRRGL